MQVPHSRLRPLLGALVAALVLTACGGGDGGESSPAKEAAPTKDDFKKAKSALADLKADYQTAYDAGAEVQKTTIAHFKSNPDATAEDPEIKSVTTAFDEAVRERVEALGEFEKLKALDDPEVAKAYETFSTKAEKGDAFHDSLYASFPLLRQALVTCGNTFAAAKVSDTPSSAAAMGRTMLTQSRPALAACLPLLKRLSASENPNLVAFSSGLTDIFTERRTLMTRLSKDEIAMAAFSAQYKSVSGRINEVGKSIDFQKQLNALSPVPEFLALEKVVGGKVT